MERISIGFVGGGGLALRIPDEALAALRGALPSGEGWHDVETDEGTVSVRLDQVVYLRTESTESKVGFGL